MDEKYLNDAVKDAWKIKRKTWWVLIKMETMFSIKLLNAVENYIQMHYIIYIKWEGVRYGNIWRRDDFIQYTK